MMCEGNSVFGLDVQKLLPLIRPEIELEDAVCINVGKKVASKKEYLLITSVATHSILSTFSSTKIVWSVRHADVTNVSASRSLHGRYVADYLRIEAQGRVYEFQFGFMDNMPSAKELRDIAEFNTNLMVKEIKQQVEARSVNRPVDPDLERFHRGRALIDSEPPSDTESCEGWTRDDYEALFNWMKTALSRGQQRLVWERRLALGSKLGQHEASNEVWFWINAFPALAGLNLGLKGHPFVAICAGSAEQVVDRSDTGQMTAIRQIQKLFFG